MYLQNFSLTEYPLTDSIQTRKNDGSIHCFHVHNTVLNTLVSLAETSTIRFLNIPPLLEAENHMALHIHKHRHFPLSDMT